MPAPHWLKNNPGKKQSSCLPAKFASQMSLKPSTRTRWLFILYPYRHESDRQSAKFSYCCSGSLALSFSNLFWLNQALSHQPCCPSPHIVQRQSMANSAKFHIVNCVVFCGAICPDSQWLANRNCPAEIVESGIRLSTIPIIQLISTIFSPIISNSAFIYSC